MSNKLKRTARRAQQVKLAAGANNAGSWPCAAIMRAMEKLTIAQTEGIQVRPLTTCCALYGLTCVRCRLSHELANSALNDSPP